jgi:aspartate racemase
MYGQLRRTAAVACDDDLDRLSQLYEDVALSGMCDDAQRDALFAAGQRMVTEQGAEAIILAGTDLNLAFDGRHDPGYRVIDALDVHVGMLADLAAGRTRLETGPTAR